MKRTWLENIKSEPKPETIKARNDLDKILKGTGFNHRTKGLWAYYRGNESATVRLTNPNRARIIYTLNLKLNGALSRRMSNPCQGCHDGYCKSRKDEQWTTCRFEASIRETTLARWEYALTLIDIAKDKCHG